MTLPVSLLCLPLSVGIGLLINHKMSSIPGKSPKLKVKKQVDMIRDLIKSRKSTVDSISQTLKKEISRLQVEESWLHTCMQLQNDSK